MKVAQVRVCGVNWIYVTDLFNSTHYWICNLHMCDRIASNVNAFILLSFLKSRKAPVCIDFTDLNENGSYHVKDNARSMRP